MKKLNKSNLIIGLVFLLLGLLFGWIFFGGDTEKVGHREEVALEDHDHAGETTWTCSMHPQIRQEDPGQCPICGMDLIPVEGDEDVELLDSEIQMTEAALKIADVQTVKVERSQPYKEIYLPGKVQVDETRISDITARFNGRIEKLFINFTGQEVYKGQKMASIYSPQLVTAQKELLEAQKMKDTNPALFNSAINKLKLWDLNQEQIQTILASGEIQYNFNVLAPNSGTVVERNVSTGEYVTEGKSLFQVANLNEVWVQFDAYESDLAWIKTGDDITFTIESLPGKTFTSQIAFIDPVIDPNSRVASVRAEVDNPKGTLKPEMFAQGMLNTTLPALEEALIIPKTAVLWTGKRAIVYVKQPNTQQPVFQFREIILGPEAGNQYVVAEGLEAGEEVVANGVFKVDAAAQLQGKMSMMNPATGQDPNEAHQHTATEENPVNVDGQTLAEPKVGEVDEQFKQQIAAVFNQYLELKNKLVDSDAQAASNAAETLSQLLKDVDMTLLSGSAHDKWMAMLGSIQKSTQSIMDQKELEAQRKAFSDLTSGLYETVKQFNITGLNAYYQYCPMAFDNNGAYWLSQSREIRNPYFGESMMTCGVTRETID
ncbi:MAG: efflux RND transporter periplasmic adaptor subunit [Candidatus Cyclobacteriaceae bacterium M3_2C_046]